MTYEEMEGKAENRVRHPSRARVEAWPGPIQRERFKGLSIRCNGEMGGGQIRGSVHLIRKKVNSWSIFFSVWEFQSGCTGRS